MLKIKYISKSLSILMAIVLTFTGVGNSFVFAKELNEFDLRTEKIVFDEGIFLYEYKNNDALGQTLSIINLDTNEEQIVFKKGDNVYIKNANGEILEVAKIENDKSPIFKRTNSDWIYFGPDRYEFDLVGVVSVAVAAGIIGFALGGPVASFKAALKGLGAGAVFDGIYAYKWGRYKFVGTGIHGEYSSQLYQPNGKTLGPQVDWSGKR